MSILKAEALAALPLETILLSSALGLVLLIAFLRSRIPLLDNGAKPVPAAASESQTATIQRSPSSRIASIDPERLKAVDFGYVDVVVSKLLIHPIKV